MNADAAHVRPEIGSMLIPIGDVRQHPRNPRRGNVEGIELSLRQHGQYKPIVAQKSTGWILLGNHTHQAAARLGWSHIAAIYLDVEDDQAVRILLTDNRTSDLGTYDDAELAGLLQELAGLDSTAGLAGTGWDEEALDELLSTLDETPLPDFDPQDEQPRLDRSKIVHECPECGHRWRDGESGQAD